METAATKRVFGYGLIGCGTFGRFCLTEYSRMDNVVPRAVTDAHEPAALAAAEAHDVAAEATVSRFLSRDDIDIVHIATPPATHHELAMAALSAGKHVICEKPLATAMPDALEMAATAARAGRILAVNLIMRYDPLTQAAKAVIDSGVLGEPLHAFLENYAGDEPLSPSHWFWDRDMSGGIFVEHGVHFFDLFEMWFGVGVPVAAQQTIRPGTDVVEQAQCACTYGDTVLATMYHGFHQPSRLDRQEFRIVFERGDLRLFEWVPTALEIDAIATATQVDELRRIVPNATVDTFTELTSEDRHVTSRFRSYEVDGRVQIRGTTGMIKQELYGHVVRALLQDQIDAIADPSHQRLVSEANGVDSLERALRAKALAEDR